ncbi:hypothetical protein HLB44_30865 [Aquincola sp. S2]|uniref:Uncharacterized protein n=1 Tax=Pseudaquabacterium terrae TaxID=2732868 RepID=A0ABX2ESC4_9BURK|nr:hypothetical protein [Aquabacterium terrae]NRF71396.1 hypothetical protein [Aquabacterium terrae]
MRADVNKPWFATPAGATLYIAIHALAVLDAIAVPAAIMWWFAHLTRGGGPFGTTAAVLTTLWALKRAWRAIFRIDEYDWMVVKALFIVALLALVVTVVHVWQWVTRLMA